MSFTNKEGFLIAVNLVNTIQANKAYLSEIDGAVGDGDHGINMNKGFTLAQQEFNADAMIMSEGFMIIGSTLINKIGGSMGPLYGAFFRGLASASSAEDIIDKRVFLFMLQKAESNIGQLTSARPGDKTLIDVLQPAVAAYQCGVESGEDFDECLAAMMRAGTTGLLVTRDLVARVGRGSRLGERSKGHLDAGATSCHLILITLAETAIQLNKLGSNGDGKIYQ